MITRIFNILRLSPLIHFMAIGGVIFLLKIVFGHYDLINSCRNNEPIVISAAQIEMLRSDWAASKSRLPTPEEGLYLIENRINDELLYREALRLGMDRSSPVVQRRLGQVARFILGSQESEQDDLLREARKFGLDQRDVVIRRHLIQRMRLLMEQITPEEFPTEADIEVYYASNVDNFLQSIRLKLSHVYLSEERRGDFLKTEASRVLDELRAEAVDPEVAPYQGDPFIYGYHFSSRSQQDLTGIFGEVFAQKVMNFEIGSWCGPIKSCYGLHLVWVHEKTAPCPAPFEAVRSRVVHQLLAEWKKQRLENSLQQLRDVYEIRVEKTSES
ncbi:MAG: peptidyl-prolyl cis-trans isomerase [Deltaproteobacteria bacterium]|nr:peptidyl-prolyl cis-trans isomerase [Deltaproteobacteria bacterium]